MEAIKPVETATTYLTTTPFDKLPGAAIPLARKVRSGEVVLPAFDHTHAPDDIDHVMASVKDQGELDGVIALGIMHIWRKITGHTMLWGQVYNRWA